MKITVDVHGVGVWVRLMPDNLKQGFLPKTLYLQVFAHSLSFLRLNDSCERQLLRKQKHLPRPGLLVMAGRAQKIPVSTILLHCRFSKDRACTDAHAIYYPTSREGANPYNSMKSVDGSGSPLNSRSTRGVLDLGPADTPSIGRQMVSVAHLHHQTP